MLTDAISNCVLNLETFRKSLPRVTIYMCLPSPGLIPRPDRVILIAFGLFATYIYDADIPNMFVCVSNKRINLFALVA